MNKMEKKLFSVNSLVFNNVVGDHNIIDDSQDHSTNTGPHAGAKTRNIGFGAGATNLGPGAGGINNNHGPGAGGLNSGRGAGSINASSINGGVEFGYANPLPKQDRYSPPTPEEDEYSTLPSLYQDNQTGSILDSMLHHGPSTWLNRSPDFDSYSDHHHYFAAGSD